LNQSILFLNEAICFESVQNSKTYPSAGEKQALKNKTALRVVWTSNLINISYISFINKRNTKQKCEIENKD
jgi:hypothetical protein